MAKGKRWRMPCPGCGRRVAVGFMAGNMSSRVSLARHSEKGQPCPKSGATVARRDDQLTLGGGTEIDD